MDSLLSRRLLVKGGLMLTGSTLLEAVSGALSRYKGKRCI
jgi:hypothetical protein